MTATEFHQQRRPFRPALRPLAPAAARAPVREAKPIFTIRGTLAFLSGVTESFWRGEFVWHLEQIRSPWMDWFYLGSSAVFLTASLLALLTGRNRIGTRRGSLIATSFATLAFSVLLLAALSIAFEFGAAGFPSRELPYFLAGRLILCALLPFLVLYVDGLGRVFACERAPGLPLAILTGIAVAITLSEWLLSRPVFPSPYNWFHLAG